VTAAAAGTISLGGELAVNRLGFGAMWIGNAGPDGARALLRRAVALGVNLIDTADVYGHGSSEEAIAAALHPYPPGLVIATKGGQVHVDGRPVPDGRPERLRRACEESLRRLRLDTIPLYQLHSPDPDVPLAESLGAMLELQAEGKVRMVGVSNVFAGQLEPLLDEFPVVSVQNQYNPMRRRSDAELSICAARGIAFLPYRPLASGALAASDAPTNEAVASGAASPAQVTLAWLLHHSPVMVPIPGTSSIEHLEENMGAARLMLDDRTAAVLDALESPSPRL
jgi:aryl-alcohol dehydrogenase-like predicted oxidoreductase